MAQGGGVWYHIDLLHITCGSLLICRLVMDTVSEATGKGVAGLDSGSAGPMRKAMCSVLSTTRKGREGKQARFGGSGL